MSSRRGEPKGEGSNYSGAPSSLYGKVSVTEMGSRASRETAPTQQSSGDAKPLLKSKALTSLLKVTDEFEGISYRPKTKDTRQAFDFMVSLVHSLMGADQPQSVTLSAVDGVLQILKAEGGMKDLDRKRGVDELIGAIDNDRFMQLVNLGKRITDYDTVASGLTGDDGEEDEESGVAVVFEEEEDDGKEYVEAIGEADSDDEDDANGFTLVQGMTEVEDIFVVGGEPDHEYSFVYHVCAHSLCSVAMQIDGADADDVCNVNLEELAFAEGNP